MRKLGYFTVLTLVLLIGHPFAQEPEFIEHPKVGDLHSDQIISSARPSAEDDQTDGLQFRGIFSSQNAPEYEGPSVKQLVMLESISEGINKLYRSNSRIEVIFASSPAGANVISIEDRKVLTATNTRGSVEANLLNHLAMTYDGVDCPINEKNIYQKSEALVLIRCDFE